MSLFDLISKPIKTVDPTSILPKPVVSPFAAPTQIDIQVPPSLSSSLAKPISTVVPGSINEKVQKIASDFNDSQLTSGIGDANHWKTDVVKDFPFTPAAHDLINKSVNYTYNPDLGANMPIAGRTGTDNPNQYEVQLGKDSSSDTAKYETFHAIFAHSKIDPTAFNAAWDKAKKGPDNANNEISAFDEHFNQYPDVFKQKGGPQGAENIDNNPASLATERFASLGLAYGNEGISAIPKDLQPFYKAYIGEKLGTNIPPAQNSLSLPGKPIDLKSPEGLSAESESISQEQKRAEVALKNVDKTNPESIAAYNDRINSLNARISAFKAAANEYNWYLNTPEAQAKREADKIAADKNISDNIPTASKSTPAYAPNVQAIGDPFSLLPGLSAIGESIHQGSMKPIQDYAKQKTAALLGGKIDENGNYVEGTLKERAAAIENMTLSLGAGGEGETISSAIAKKIAKSTDEVVISNLLRQEIPTLPSDQTDAFAKVFKDINNPKDVTTAINRIKTQISDANRLAPVTADSNFEPNNIPKNASNSAISQDLQPLANEAKKYKSAQEFIKANTDAYHSTSANLVGDLKVSKDGAMGSGIYLSENPNTAREAGAAQSDGNLSDQIARPVKILANKIFETKDINYPDSSKLAQIKKDGYEGIKTGTGEIVIFDPKNVKYDTQLADFYNKVVGTKPAETTPVTAQDIVGDGKDFAGIEARTAKYVADNKDFLKQEYVSRHGNVFSVDNFKDLVPGHSENKTISEAFHRPAAEVMSEMINTALQNAEGKTQKAIFLGGATGAGKTSAIRNLTNPDFLNDNTTIVVDGTLADGNRSSDTIRQALKTGHKVEIYYVDTTPEQLLNNLVKRAKAGDRTVPIETAYNSLQKSRQNVFRLIAKFNENPKFNLSVIDNSNPANPQFKLDGSSFLKQKLYTADDIAGFKKSAYTKINKLYEQKAISEKVYEGFTRRKGEVTKPQGNGEVGQFHGEESQGGVGQGKEVKVTAPKKGKTESLDTLYRRLDREEQSLQAALSNPEGHAKAYGEDMKPEYRAKIAELKSQIADEEYALKPQISPEVLSLEVELKAATDALNAHPARSIAKYVSSAKGELPEVLGGPKQGKFARFGDTIVTESGFSNSEQARRSYEDYVKQSVRVEAMKEEYQSAKRMDAKRRAIEKDILDTTKLLARIEAKETNVQKSIESLAKSKEKTRLESIKRTSEVQRTLAHENLRRLERTVLSLRPELEQETLSLQALADQSSLPEYSGLPSLQEIVIDTATPVKKKVGILDYWRTPDRVLEKIGMSNNAKEIRVSYENYLSELPQHLAVLQEWNDRALKYASSDYKIFQYLDGELKRVRDGVTGKLVVDLKPEEYLVAEEIKAYLKDWALRLNLPEDNQISHYITHIFEDNFIEKEFDEDMAKIIRNKIPGQVYDPFLEKRLGKKGYIQSARQALEAYMKRAVRKANMDTALEHLKRDAQKLELSQYQYVKKFADSVNLRPSDVDNLVDNTIKQLFGYRFGGRPTARATRTLRKMIFRGSLGLNFNSAVRNLTQGVNTYAKLGEKYTAIGYTKLLTQVGSKELVEHNILGQDMVQDKTLSVVNRFVQKADTGLFAMFQMAEKINRGAAYWGAKAKGIDEGMSETQAIDYAKKIVRDTQFQFGSIDSPLALRSDIAKTFFQFGSYSVKQAEFLAEALGKKNWGGVIRYILASLFIVVTVGKLFNIKYSDFIPNPLAMFGIGGSKFGAPSLALPSEIMKAILDVPGPYGKQRDWTQKGKDIARAGVVYVPGGVQGMKLWSGLSTYFGDTKNKIEDSKTNLFKAATGGKANLTKTANANDILKKYGIDTKQNAASDLLKKYGIK